MISLTCTAVLHAALLSTGGASYSEAHKLNLETGRPLVVLVGADWCPHCQVMKQSTMPQLAQRGVLGKVAFAEVNSDHEGPLARQLMNGGPIPQLIMYHKTADGWQRKLLVGSHSAGEIESFLQQGLAAPSVTQSTAQQPAVKQTSQQLGAR